MHILHNLSFDVTLFLCFMSMFLSKSQFFVGFYVFLFLMILSPPVNYNVMFL
ncbi:unnamed protein product [Brassica rapa subsp. narinosa]